MLRTNLSTRPFYNVRAVQLEEFNKLEATGAFDDVVESSDRTESGLFRAVIESVSTAAPA